MNGTKCKLCRKPGTMSYEVQRDRAVPLCGACFGSWQPHELNALLGVTPDGEKKEKRHATAAAG